MKIKKYISLFLLAYTFTSIKVFSQPVIQWQKSLGGTDDENLATIQQTVDGGYIAGGHSSSNDGNVFGHHGSTFYFDYWVVKLDVTGIIQWQKSLGGDFNEQFKMIQQTTDGGCIVAGSSKSSNGDVSGHHGTNLYYDYWIVKLNASGTIQWQKSLGGSQDDQLEVVQQANDGGYIIGGTSYSNNGDINGHHGTTSFYDYWIVKLDAMGVIQWQKSLGGTNDEYLKTIQQTTDGGYIIGGISFSNDGDVTGHHGPSSQYDYWIVKLDANGAMQWQKSLGGTAHEFLKSIQETSDGGYIIAGESSSGDGDVSGHHGTSLYNDYWLVKIDNIGNIQWQKSFGGTDGEYFSALQQASNGDYILVGTSYSNDGDITGHHGTAGTPDYWAVKLSPNGIIQWQNSLGGTNIEVSNIILQTIDGGYIAGGYSRSNDGDVSGHHGTSQYEDYWIVKLDANGTIQWQKSLGGSDSDYFSAIQQTSDGGYIVGGTSWSSDGDLTGNNGLDDYWLIKLNSPTIIEDNSITNHTAIYPNPTTGLINLNFVEASKSRIVEVYNLLGEKIVAQLANELQDKIDLQDYSTGIYFIKVIENDEQVCTQKIIKQ